MAIDTIYIKNSSGQDTPYPIGAGAENVIYNENLPGSAPANSVHNKIKTYDTHVNTKAVSSSNGVHGIRYYDNKLSVLNGNNQQVEAAGTGDMRAQDQAPSGYIQIGKGGTGNNDGYIRAGQRSGTSIGIRATAEGYNVIASGDYSHAEGQGTTAIDTNAHVEGYTTYANTDAHAEGHGTCAQGRGSHAEGGYYTVEGNVGTFALGYNAHAEGLRTYASGANSHAEGYETTAKIDPSHAEGLVTLANGLAAHAEGYGTCATGQGSHSEGEITRAQGRDAHAEGYKTFAIGDGSHAGGCYTAATNYGSYAIGHRNAAMTTGGTASNQTGTAFVIGNGITDGSGTNAFAVEYDGTVSSKGSTLHPGSDYAEFFEQSDSNSNNEDRVGHFVTFDEEEKIKIASSEDEYILGIVSGFPSVIGNGDCYTQTQMEMRDKFNRIQYEPAPLYEINEETGEEEQVFDDKGNPVYQGFRPIYNPEYDPTRPYVSRKDRPEWAPIGMLGVLAVIDDGTCEVGGYCKVAENGIATAAEGYDKNTYRVIKRIDETTVKVVFR